jgi:hypothetical protein
MGTDLQEQRSSSRANAGHCMEERDSYRDAKQRRLPKTPPLAAVMNSGCGITMLAGIVGWFV